MNKKIWIILGSIFSGLVIAGAIVIAVLSMKEPPKETFSMNGAWLVYQDHSKGVENEYYVFDDTTATQYRDGQVLFESEYNIEYVDNEINLNLTKNELTLYIRKWSKNSIILVGESAGIDRKLVRISDSLDNIPNVTEIYGDYNLLLVSGKGRDKETVKFENGVFTDSRDGQVYMSSKYTLDGTHTLTLENPAMTFKIYKYQNNVYLIDGQDFLWELVEINID